MTRPQARRFAGQRDISRGRPQAPSADPNALAQPALQLLGEAVAVLWRDLQQADVCPGLDPGDKPSPLSATAATTGAAPSRSRGAAPTNARQSNSILPISSIR